MLPIKWKALIEKEVTEKFFKGIGAIPIIKEVGESVCLELISKHNMPAGDKQILDRLARAYCISHLVRIEFAMGMIEKPILLNLYDHWASVVEIIEIKSPNSAGIAEMVKGYVDEKKELITHQFANNTRCTIDLLIPSREFVAIQQNFDYLLSAVVGEERAIEYQNLVNDSFEEIINQITRSIFSDNPTDSIQ